MHGLEATGAASLPNVAACFVAVAVPMLPWSSGPQSVLSKGPSGQEGSACETGHKAAIMAFSSTSLAQVGCAFGGVGVEGLCPTVCTPLSSCPQNEQLADPGCLIGLTQTADLFVLKTEQMPTGGQARRSLRQSKF